MMHISFVSQEKLSMLGDIESGKYGKAAELLQSDAVAFSVQSNAESKKRRGHVRSSSHGSSVALSRSDSATIQDGAFETVSSTVVPEQRKPVVETRSLLTLRMGFVSMSYGILLQWDCETKLVELIVLRKMCREDFLERNNEDVDDSPIATATKFTKSSTCAESTASGTTLESNGSRSQELGMTGLSLFPQLLSEPDQGPESFLSVSVVSVKHIHTGCDLCLDSRFFHDQPGSKSKDKRNVLRPYIRFVLGKNGAYNWCYFFFLSCASSHTLWPTQTEHCTKPSKLLPNGHLYYYKRHNNSCQLPMPKEEFRWFAGQEDLMVEVRDLKSSPTNRCVSVKGNRKSKHSSDDKDTSKPSAKDEQFSSADPILAVVTVPLSSVNIEDEEDKLLPSDGEESVSLTPWKHRKAKKHDFSRDKTSSTNITLPLRMVGCSSTSFGSITLQITVKVPRQTGVASSSHVATVSERNGAAEESIEIGAIARIMQGWAIYDSGATDDENTKSSSKSRRRKILKPRWNKKWNPKTKKWNKLKLNNHGSSRITSTEQANWFTFLKWGDEK